MGLSKKNTTEQNKNPNLIHTDNSTVITRGKLGWGEVEESKGYWVVLLSG